MSARAGDPGAGGVRVLIVDDHALFAESLRLSLRALGFEASRAAEPDEPSVIDAVASSEPDVVLLDLDLGSDATSGQDLIPLAGSGGARVLMLTGVRDRLRLSACLEAGAVGLIDKDVPIVELADGITRAARGEHLTPVTVRAELLDELRAARADQARRRRCFESLTAREREVLEALSRGRSVAAIAEDSGVSVGTVRVQVGAVLRKLGVNSQMAAVIWANDNRELFDRSPIGPPVS